MKVRRVEEIEEQPINNTDIKGFCLVEEKDGFGFVFYEQRFQSGYTGYISCPFGVNVDQVYHCMEGKAEVVVMGEKCQMERDCVLAAAGNVRFKLHVTEDVRFAVVYSKQKRSESTAVFKTNNSIAGTECDVTWNEGSSQRYLVAKDETEFTFAVNTYNQNTTSKVCHQNNKRVLYFNDGKGHIKWDDTRHEFGGDDKKGLLVVADDNKVFEVSVGDQTARSVFLLTPPLNGNEAY